MFIINKVLGINNLKIKKMRKIMLLIAAVAIVSLSSCVDGPTYVPSETPQIMEEHIVVDSTLSDEEMQCLIYKTDTLHIN